MFFFVNCYMNPLVTFSYNRTSKNMTCGWQQKMECFYTLQRVNGWQQCRSIWIWNGWTVWRWSTPDFEMSILLNWFPSCNWLNFWSCVSACFWVLHGKNTSFTFWFWREGNFTFMELQICRCLNCSYVDFDLLGFHLSFLLLMILLFQADVEFGKLQARDMLQHLWTGPISNSSVEVVQGSRSVEVRAVGVTKVISCF